MGKALRYILFFTAIVLALFGGAGCNVKQKTITQLAFKAQKDRIIEDFPKIPHDEILQQISGNRLYGELQEEYKNSLISLKTLTDKDAARLVVVVITPEVGKAATLANNYGIPYIKRTCENVGVDYIDFSNDFTEVDMTEVMQVTDEGAWSKNGAALVAKMLDTVLMRYHDQESSRKSMSAGRPAIFGDLQPGRDEIVDGNNNMPYHVKVNAQGLRMNHDLAFPKTKQTILILSDAKMYSPFLDNDFIATNLLQKKYPDKEIINAAVPNYTMDDYETLYKEKARFTEPDLVIVVTDGSDILDEFFTQRNHYSRTQKLYLPTKVEADFYDQLYRR